MTRRHLWFIFAGCGAVVDCSTAAHPSKNSTPRSDALVQRSADASVIRQATIEIGSTECPAGGTAIETGLDGNGNGTLDDSEVTSRTPVCNGAVPLPMLTLTRIDAFAPGEDNCPAAGRRLSTGLDNGDGAGVARDGVLQAGEVDQTELLCDGSGPVHARYFPVPAGPEGSHFISTNGGHGSGNAVGDHGGDAGTLSIYEDWGSRTGAIRLFKTGGIDASWVFPPSVPEDLGSNPLVVSSNSEILSLVDSIDGDGIVTLGGKVATGLHVLAGVTLTLASTPKLTFDRDVVNQGLIKGDAPATPNAPSLDLSCMTYIGAVGSAIELRGESFDNTTPGGHGGILKLYLAQSAIDTSQAENGGFFSHSTLDVSGGDGSVGGDSGNIYVSAGVIAYNRGSFIGRGGRGLVGLGGHGSNLQLYGEWGGVFNSGTFDSSGGPGATGGGYGFYSNGGNHQGIEVTAYYPGHVYNTGTLIANGGDVDITCDRTGPTLCVAGEGGPIGLWTWGGRHRQQRRPDRSRRQQPAWCGGSWRRYHHRQLY